MNHLGNKSLSVLPSVSARRAPFACSARGRAPTPKELPGGTFWLSRESTNHDVVYGQNFIINRPKQGGPGLVVSDACFDLDCTEKDERERQLTVHNPARSGPPALQGSLWDVLDITDYTLLGESGMLPGARTPFLLPGATATVSAPASSACTGLILHPSVERDPQEEAAPDKNPRRTKKVKFTCKMCETTSVKRVSPHGWTAGSVFAKCDGCGVVHKLVDNLKIFHEFKGPVFPSTAPANLKIPDGLPQKPKLKYHVHPAIYPHLPK